MRSEAVMKMILAIYNAAVDEEVMDALHDAGVKCYTKWPQVLGHGQQTGPRLNTHVWPGANCVTMMVVSDDLAPEIMAAMRSLRRTLGEKEGVKAFLLNVEDQT